MKKFVAILLIGIVSILLILGPRLHLPSWLIRRVQVSHSEPSTLWEQEATPQGEVQQIPITPEGKSPFVKVAKELLPTVVSISAEQVLEVRSPFSDFFEDPFDDFFKRFFPEFRREYPKQKIRRPILGSGFIVSEDGYILTNNHIIERASKIVVKTMDEKEHKAEVIGTDNMTDVALIKIKAQNLHYARLGDSDEVEVGDWVMAIGSPFQLMGTVTVGVVSAKGRAHLEIAGGGPQIQNFIQTDAAINPGNSGGPLVNIKGEVIGINTAIKTAGVYPAGNIGIGFAIPINIAKKVKEDLFVYKEVRRGWLGISYQRLTQELAAAYELKEPKGVLVQKVLPNSPALEAGIKEEDIITEWDNKEVSFDAFPSMVAQTKIGKEVAVKILRKGKTLTLSVKVGKRPTEEEVAKTTAEEWLGIQVTANQEGVVVAKVKEDSPAYEAGIQPGDVIKRIGEKEIQNIKDYKDAKSTYSRQKSPILFKLQRGDMTIFVALTPER
ncbi:MAG: Do family serine endopeptidase [bacterium]|nr:Do family serine endopeptidase [bacterium]